MISPYLVRRQVAFLGYREALETVEPGTVLWLVATSDAPGKHPKGKEAGIRDLIFPVTLGTFDETITLLIDRLSEADDRGCKRLSLSEALYAIEPTGESGNVVGSWQRNQPVLPKDFRVFWADIDVNTGEDGHQEQDDAYPLARSTELPNTGAYSGAMIAEHLGSAYGEWPLASVLVDTGSGSFQVYIRFERDTVNEAGELVPGVTEAEFSAYLMRCEERYERHFDRGVVTMHGPIRVWGHNRLGGNRVEPMFRLEGWEAASAGMLAARPLDWGKGWRAPEAERYAARLSAAEAEAEKKRVAVAAAQEARAARIAAGGEGVLPGTRLESAVPASAIVEVLYDGRIGGDRIALRRDADISIKQFEDGTEFVITNATRSCSTLGIEARKPATSFGLLCAAAGAKGAGRIARAFDGKFNELLPWLAKNRERLLEAAQELTLPRTNRSHPKKPRTIVTFEEVAEELNSKVSAADLSRNPDTEFATASAYLLALNGGNTTKTIADIKGLLAS